MYTLPGAAWLAIYLADRGTRLDYKLVWANPNPVRLPIQVWYVACKLNYVRFARVLRKVVRFLDSSGIFSCRHEHIYIASHSSIVQFVHAQMRTAIHHLTQTIAYNVYPEFVVWLRQHIHVHRTTRPTLLDALESQIAHAKKFNLEALGNIDTERQSWYT